MLKVVYTPQPCADFVNRTRVEANDAQMDVDVENLIFQSVILGFCSAISLYRYRNSFIGTEVVQLIYTYHLV